MHHLEPKDPLYVSALLKPQNGNRGVNLPDPPQALTSSVVDGRDSGQTIYRPLLQVPTLAVPTKKN